MSDNNDHGLPGRSLLAEMTELRHQMTNLRAAMLQLCDVVKEIDIKVENQSELLEGLGDIVRNVIDLKADKIPITDGETPVQVV